jgi:outer membrane protein, multidrug efflux system
MQTSVTALHRATTWAMTGLSLLLACACATPTAPESRYTVDLPAGWSVAAADAAANQATALDAGPWWARFGDTTLSTLAVQAAQHNTRIQTAEAALRQARALRDVSAAALSPTLGLSAQAQRGKTGRAAPSTNFSAGLNAAFEPLADRNGLDASEGSLRAQAAQLGSVQVAVATELGLAYVDLRSSQARLVIAQANLASQQQTLEIVQWRLQAGLVTPGDTDQARSAVAQTAAQLPLLRTRIEQAAHALAVLTGQAPASLWAQLRSAQPLPKPAADLALSLPADTLRQRADVRAAEHEVDAAWSRVAQADAAQRPTLKLGGSLGLNALTLSGLGSAGALSTAVFSSVAWPLFDGGALRAQARAQRAAFDSARIAWQATVLAALQSVEDALVKLRDDRDRLLQLQQAAVLSSRAAQLTRQRFSSGLQDFQAVLETQRAAFATEDAVASAQADISADLLRLFQALGGGWRPINPSGTP